MSSTTLDRRQGLSGNLAIKAPVDCATTGGITLSGEQTIDGVTTSESRVLVLAQTNAVENGIYDSSSASWTRAIDFSGVYDAAVGTLVEVATGSTLGGQFYIVSGTAPITIGSSSISFSAAPLAVGSLAAQLADTASAGNGDALIGVKSALTGGVATTQHAVNARTVWVDDFGASTTASAAANATAFAAAYAALIAAGGGKLMFGAGTYNCTTWPIVRGATAYIGVELVGAGQRVTSIVKSGADANPVISISSSSATAIADGLFEIQGIRIAGNAASGPCLQMTRVSRTVLRDVYLETGSIGLDLSGSLTLELDHCGINNNVTGIRTRKDSSGTICCNNITIIGGLIHQNSTYGMDIGDCGALLVMGTAIELNGKTDGTAPTTTGDVVIRSTCGSEAAFAAFNFINTWHEANYGHFKVEAATYLRLKFDGMQSLTDTTYPNNVDVGAIAHMTVINSGFAGTFTVAASRFTAISSEFATLTNTSIAYEYIGIKDGATWKNLSIQSNLAGSSVTLDPSTGALIVGATGTVSPGLAATAAATALTVSSNTIAPTAALHSIGAGLIKTITVPAIMAGQGGSFSVIPTAAFTTDTTANIGLASTATIGRVMTFTYDSGAGKWYPSY